MKLTWFSTSKHPFTKKGIIAACISVIAFYLDFHYFSNITTLSTLTEILFSATASISAIWTAYYLLFFQLYKDRYPLRLVDSKVFKSMSDVFFWISFTLILGIIVIAAAFGMVFATVFSLCAIYTITRIFKGVLSSNKSLMISTHIDSYCKELSSNITSLNRTAFKNAFDNIRLIFEESIIKEEFLITQNIIENVGKVFQEYLSNSISMLTSGSKKEDVDYLFSQIVDFNVYQINVCEKANSNLLIEYVAEQNYKNLKICIDTNQYEWFKLYIDAINNEFFLLQRDNCEDISKQIAWIYNKVARCLVKQNKEEWLKYLTDNFLSLTRELNFIKGNSNLKYCAALLCSLIIYSAEKEQACIYTYLLDVFKTFTGIVSRVSMGFSDIKVYYAMIFNNLNEKSPQKTKEFIDLVFDEEFAMNDDPYWLEFKFYCLSEINYTHLNENMSEHHLQAILDLISQKSNYQGFVFLPQFSAELKENITKSESVERICSSFNKIFNRCILKDNLPAYALFLKKLNSCFDETTQTNRLTQEQLLNVYLALIYKTAALVNKQFLELSFDHFTDCLVSLDKRRAISSGFAQTIMSRLSSLCQETVHENKNVTHLVVDLLFSFQDKEKSYHCIISSHPAKKYLYRCLFNIGTSCIENNYEEGLRRVSNALGWLAIFSIEQSTRDLTNYILERASELYHIAEKMEISQKTMTFLLTLFTTVGTYCCKDPSLTPFLNKIIHSIQNADIRSIQIAISLRTSENDMWNELYSNRTDELTKKFLQAFSHSKKHPA